MANEKSKTKSYVEEVFDGMRTAEKLTNSAENTASGQSITPAPNGYGVPMMAPQAPFQSQAQYGFQPYMSDCCKSLIPGTTIGTYVRCTGAEFVIDNWKLGGLYRIETTEHQCIAFLTKKTPEVLEFSSVDDKGNTVLFEIKANDLCSDFKEKRDALYTCVYNVPTNPIVIYPLR